MIYSPTLATLRRALRWPFRHWLRVQLPTGADFRVCVRRGRVLSAPKSKAWVFGLTETKLRHECAKRGGTVTDA